MATFNPLVGVSLPTPSQIYNKINPEKPVYWVGQDNNVYFKTRSGVQNAGQAVQTSDAGFDAARMSAQATRINDPNPIPNAQTGGATPTINPQNDAYNQYVRQQAAQKAAEEKQKGELRNTITGTIGNLQGIYNQLFGDISGAATSQRQVLEQRYGRETSNLGDQFASEFPSIGKSYAGRGAYSSSFRQDAERKAQQQFQRQLEDIRTQKEADAAKIGEYVAKEQAKVQAQQGLIGSTLGRLGSVTDLNELKQIRNSIDAQIADVTAQRAGNMSQESYLQQFQRLAPATDRMNNLRATLSNIISGAAPTAIKQQVAQQIIGSAGLSPEEEQLLNQEIITQIGQ